MLARKPVILTSLTVFALVSLLGCFTPAADSITNNQGGSTPISLGIKLVDISQGTATLTDLNPDDLQLMAQLAEEISGVDLPDVSDELAAAAVALIAANNLETFDDLANLKDMDPADVVIPDGVEEVLLEEIEALFGDIGDPNILHGIMSRTVPTL